MSVYIKDMEMPDKCGHCRFASAFDCGVTGNFISTHSIRQADCPLIPVPEHGRLGDVDALYKNLQKQAMTAFDKDSARYRIVMDVLGAVRNAPTIIPADDSQEST